MALTKCPHCENEHICHVDKGRVNDRISELIRKWVAQANHPMRSKQPEVRDAILKCASDLRKTLADDT